VDSDLVQISNGSFPVPNMALSYLTVPISGVVPAGTTLVVKVDTADGLETYSNLFLGANRGLENGPTFIETPTCGVASPSTILSLGFNSSFVWMVSNDTNPPISNYITPCPCTLNSCVGYCGIRPWCDSTLWTPDQITGILEPPCYCDYLCPVGYQNGASGNCCPNFYSICEGIANGTGQTTGGVITNPAYSSQMSQLSGGGIAGVTIAVIVVVIAVVAIIVLVVIYLKRDKFRRAKLRNIATELDEKEARLG